MSKTLLFALLVATAACSHKAEVSNTKYEYLVFPEGCVQKILSLDQTCIKMTISKLLSLVILLGSLIIKIPQIIVILKNKSVKGISVNSYIFEMISNAANIVYYMYIGLPVKSYGENYSLLISNFISNYLKIR